MKRRSNESLINESRESRSHRSFWWRGWNPPGWGHAGGCVRAMHGWAGADIRGSPCDMMGRGQVRAGVGGGALGSGRCACRAVSGGRGACVFGSSEVPARGWWRGACAWRGRLPGCWLASRGTLEAEGALVCAVESCDALRYGSDLPARAACSESETCLMTTDAPWGGGTGTSRRSIRFQDDAS